MSTARRAPIESARPDDLTGSRVGRFLVRSKLGAGGMGEVYYAEDTKLERPVALKRVAQKLRRDHEARQHILREARRASALSSEHIAGVYDVVEERGEIFLVMEYVNGTSLRHRLEGTARLDLESFLTLALQCTEGLAAAHQKGIVHRDIKPENIMLTPAGQVKILDFGLARRLPVADDTAITASVESTSLGCAGSPGYMAPEVLLEQNLDARADIFSLGVVFYEMLTGRHPFFTTKPLVTADRTLHSSPSPVGDFVHGTPAELERIISKMLAKDPQARYANASDLLLDLRVLQRELQNPSLLPNPSQVRLGIRIALQVLVAAVVIVGAYLLIKAWPWIPPDVGIILPEKKNLAVLPFIPAEGDASVRAFGGGLAETLTAKLTKLTAKYPLQIVPPSEIRKLSTPSVEEARAQLGVNLVLEGSLHQSGPRMRVNYTLVDAGTRRVLRADTITADTADLFGLEDRVVDSALRALDLELSTRERQTLTARGTNQPEAYDFYLRGRGYLQEYQKPENIESAIEVFRRALDRDPGYALAYAGLGESYWQKYELTHDREWVTKALDACQRATASGVGHDCLGTVYAGTGRYDEAKAEFERALQADATNDDVYRGLAYAYEGMGKMSEAEDTYRRAIRARPEYWASYNWLGGFLFRQARYEEAARMFARVTDLAPDNFNGYNNLGGVYLQLGRYADAISLFERSVSIRPAESAWSNLGTAYFYQRRFPDASRAYEQALKFNERQRSVWGNLGDAYYWQPGRRADSVAAYRRAVALAEEQLRVNPRDATLLSYLAFYHAMLREEQKASANLNRALVLAPSNPQVLLNAALVANQLGNEAAAITWLQKALASGVPTDLIRNTVNFDNLRSRKPFEQLLRANNPPDTGQTTPVEVSPNSSKQR
ncbi:MAG: protein kinase [Acidobacteriia bacterium]|nr:protein kinase [Terriglobia bacterium]